MAALTRLVLAVLGAWALAFFVFKMPFAVAPLPLAVAFLAVPFLTVITGLFNSHTGFRQS